MTVFRNFGDPWWSITKFTSRTYITAKSTKYDFTIFRIFLMTENHHSNYYSKLSWFLFQIKSPYAHEFLNYNIIQLLQSHESDSQYCHLHYFLQYPGIIVQSNWLLLGLFLFIFIVTILHPFVWNLPVFSVLVHIFRISLHTPHKCMDTNSRI